MRGIVFVVAFAVIVTALARGYQALKGDGKPAPAEERPTGDVLRQYDDRSDDVSLKDGTSVSRPAMDIVQAVVTRNGADLEFKLTFAAAPNIATLGVIVTPDDYEHQINASADEAAPRVDLDEVGSTSVDGRTLTITVPEASFPRPKRVQLHSFDTSATSVRDYVPGGAMTADQAGSKFLSLRPR
jgi:hypothetical protein